MDSKGRKKSLSRMKKCIERDDFAKLRKMLASDRELAAATLNGKWQNGLHMAAKRGSADCLRVLLEGGCDPGRRDRKGRYPLHLAAHRCLREKRSFSQSLVLELVEPLVLKTPDLDRRDRKGVACRSLLDELSKKQVEASPRPSAESPSTTDDSGSGDHMARLEEEEREEAARRKEAAAEWRERLAEEHLDDFADAYGSEAALQGAAEEEAEDRETYDNWADRIYREYFTRRRRRQEREESAKKPEKPGKTPSTRPPPPPPTKRLRLEEDPISKLRKRYSAFVRKVLADPSGEISLESLPFGLSTGWREIADAVFGDIKDREEEKGERRCKSLIRRALLTWHPDKFSQRFGQRFRTGEKDAICEVVVHVSQSLLAAAGEGDV